LFGSNRFERHPADNSHVPVVGLARASIGTLNPIQVLHIAHDLGALDENQQQRETRQRRAFLRELEAMIRLRSPNTVNVFGAVTSLPDRMVLVMELLPNGSVLQQLCSISVLFALLASRGGLSASPLSCFRLEGVLTGGVRDAHAVTTCSGALALVHN